jgi:protein AATF/BFR2
LALNSYHPHLVETLSKWSSKIQAVTPSILLPSNRNAFLAKSSQQLKSVVQLIDETLLDKDKLLARTHGRRGNSVPSDDALDAAEDKEIFDDTDFYQQLLRDIIDARGTRTGGDDWMTVQRQKKAKKKVDTKASKGRKLRQVLFSTFALQ